MLAANRRFSRLGRLGFGSGRFCLCKKDRNRLRPHFDRSRCGCGLALFALSSFDGKSKRLSSSQTVNGCSIAVEHSQTKVGKSKSLFEPIFEVTKLMLRSGIEVSQKNSPSKVCVSHYSSDLFISHARVRAW